MKTDSPSSTLSPTGWLIGASVLCAMLILLTLEISHTWFRENHRIGRSLLVFPVVLLLFAGMLARRPWALLGARIFCALAAAAFFVAGAFALYLRPIDSHGRAWIWILIVSWTIAAALAAGFFGLGARSTLLQYGLLCPRCGRKLPSFFRQLECPQCPGSSEIPANGDQPNAQNL